MDKIFSENGKIKYKEYFLLLENSTSSDFDKIPVDIIKSIIPVVDKNGNPALAISYHDDEFCCDSSLFCDSIESIEIKEYII